MFCTYGSSSEPSPYYLARPAQGLERALPMAGRSRMPTETMKNTFASDPSAGDAMQQPWFGSNFSFSPFGMPTYTSTLAYSPTSQPMLPSAYSAYQPHSDSNISSSSSEGSSFSSPSSYSESVSLPPLAYPFPSMHRSRSPPPQMAIDMSLIDGGAGYEDLLQWQSDRDPSGFTGFFSGNGDGLKGVAVEAAGIPSMDGHLVRQPDFQARRASFASSDASYESYESEPEPMVAISFDPAPAPSSSRKRSRSPQMVEPPRPARRTSTTDSTPASKRSKASHATPAIPVVSLEYDLPPLPADFDTYGPGGSSLFDDSPTSSASRAARATTPDFSGRDDCWGIGQEAYSRLSAKAKKQLRNKIGARRFRERRKEYITTLEGKLHERDEVIGAYRGRLESTLDEVAALKLKIAQLSASRS